MIKRVRFERFKALRDATLEVGRFTLLVGANGSGKSSAMDALSLLRPGVALSAEYYRRLISVGETIDPSSIRIIIAWDEECGHATSDHAWNYQGGNVHGFIGQVQGALQGQINAYFSNTRKYSLDARAIAAAVQLTPGAQLQENGAMLAAVLDQLRDQAPERFDQVNEVLRSWLPEYDHVLFDTPSPGVRSILLRTRTGGHKIPASELSQGTLIALALLTLAHLPQPPRLICLEEPDRGIHPRLLRDVRDALYRLSHPESHGESRPPVQVIATTHSPYFLDLYRDRPEEVVLAQRNEQGVVFERLADRKDINEILEGAHLGDIWYSGILGGNPESR